MQRALIVGLTSVDPAQYDGWDGRNGCTGCEIDARNITSILKPLDYDIQPLITEKATKSAILEELTHAAKSLKDGDIFVFYYSGHGGQQPDRNRDETDGKDETLVAYDGEIIDDELNEIWLQFKPGVRIVMISDSCNAGSNYRNRFDIMRSSPIEPITDLKASSEMQAQMIHMGGCRDSATSSGFDTGGEFTSALCKVWNRGAFRGNYRALYQGILPLIRTGQQPQYNEYGKVTDTFRNQRPFETDASRCWEPGLGGNLWPTFPTPVGFRSGVPNDSKEISLCLSVRGTDEENLKFGLEQLGQLIAAELVSSAFSREPRPCTFSGSVSGSSRENRGWSVGGTVSCTW